jgi:phosphotransferase system enzyme I (PtsI)
MIEVPSAAIIADLLAKEADFVSVGTNDLIQYTLAIDRGNDMVAYLYEPFHPAMLRSLADIANKVHAAEKPLSMCGEMAADPIAIPLLIGMGYTELSMNPLSIPVIKSVIRAISAKMCQELAKQALQIPSIRELNQFMHEKLSEHYALVKNIKLSLPFGEQIQ